MKKLFLLIAICSFFLLISCNNVPSHEHKWDSGTITKVATCKTSGEKTFKCGCGATKVEETAIDPNNHAVDNYSIYKEATYIEEGEEKGICNLCNNEVVRKYLKSLAGTTWKGSMEEGNDQYIYFESDNIASFISIRKELIEYANYGDYQKDKTYLIIGKDNTSYQRNGVAIKAVLDGNLMKAEIKKNEEGKYYLYAYASNPYNPSQEMVIILDETNEKIPEHEFTEAFDVCAYDWHALKCTATHDHGTGIEAVILEARIPHTITSWTQSFEGTCNLKGREKGECTVCGGIVERETVLGNHSFNRSLTQHPSDKTPSNLFDTGSYIEECMYCNEKREVKYYKDLAGMCLKITQTEYEKDGEKYNQKGEEHIYYYLFLRNGKLISVYPVGNTEDRKMMIMEIFDGYNLDREKMKFSLKKGSATYSFGITQIENGKGFEYTTQYDGELINNRITFDEENIRFFCEKNDDSYHKYYVRDNENYYVYEKESSEIFLEDHDIDQSGFNCICCGPIT